MKRFVPEWLVRYVVLVGILIGGGALWWYWPEQPEPLLQAARRAHRGSLEAEDLATRSIVAARGDYPAAQFLLCQVLADRGRWSESALQFDKIQRPGQLGVEELCEFAEQAQQEQQDPYAAILLQSACLPLFAALSAV